MSNLDAKLREALRSELKELQVKLRATFLFVTHDQIEAMSMGDKIGVLNEGKIVQIGTPHEIYNRPKNIFVASFVGSPSINLIPAEIAGGKLSAMSGKLKLAIPAAKKAAAVTLGIRAEDITVGSGESVVARVHDVENHGVEKIVTLCVDDQYFKAVAPSSLVLKVDGSTKFSFNSAKLHYFDSATGMRLAGASL